MDIPIFALYLVHLQLYTGGLRTQLKIIVLESHVDGVANACKLF